MVAMVLCFRASIIQSMIFAFQRHLKDTLPLPVLAFHGCWFLKLEYRSTACICLAKVWKRVAYIFHGAIIS